MRRRVVQRVVGNQHSLNAEHTVERNEIRINSGKRVIWNAVLVAILCIRNGRLTLCLHVRRFRTRQRSVPLHDLTDKSPHFPDVIDKGHVDQTLFAKALLYFFQLFFPSFQQCSLCFASDY